MRITRRTLLNTLAFQTLALATAAHPRRKALAEPTPVPASEPAPKLHDPDRPAFHLLPARNWMNDPCAPIYYRGQYHMFHQYNPHSAVWGDMNWAHATSPDMVHWTRQPIALSPDHGSSDSEGCFTGSAFLHNGHPTILYTGVATVPRPLATLADGNNNFRETQNLATATDATLRTWRKLPAPVIPTPPLGMAVTGFRDPCPFQLDGHWYTLIGSGIPCVGGNVLLYRAANPDLTKWEYLHPLTQGSWGGKPGNNPVDTGEMWECPDFFPLGNAGKWVLIHSTQGKTLWQAGTLDRKTLTFHTETTGELDYGLSPTGNPYYAPKTQLDARGNRILWGWLPETRPEADFAAAGWSGMMSLPRVLTLDGTKLQFAPAPQTERLRLRPNPRPNQLPTLSQEFQCALLTTRSGPATPYVLSDPAGPLIEIRSDPTQDLHTVLLTSAAGTTEIKLPQPLLSPAGLHLFVDNSVVELFLDSRYCVTRRFYQSRHQTGACARTPGKPILTLTLPGAVTVTRPQSFTLKSIWTA